MFGARPDRFSIPECVSIIIYTNDGGLAVGGCELDVRFVLRYIYVYTGSDFVFLTTPIIVTTLKDRFASIGNGNKRFSFVNNR